MKQTYTLIFLISLFLLSCGSNENVSAENTNPPSEEKQTLLLISIDGFRHDYLSRAKTPGLDTFKEKGTYAKNLVPVFPSKTFPNHYSQVTGLYPDHHGIIMNSFYDLETGEKYSLSSAAAKEGKWYGGEPVWVTAEKQNKRTACYFWPGSEAEIKGTRPTEYKAYDKQKPYDERVTEVLEWLGRPEEIRPEFITLYFSDVDSKGHGYGPDATEPIQAVESLDKHIQTLYNGLVSGKMLDRVNVVFVSDHGMSQLSRDRMVFLDDYLSEEQLGNLRISNYSPVTFIETTNKEEVYNALKGQNENFSVYYKEDIPDDLHFNSNKNIPEIVGVAADGYSVTTRSYFEGKPNNYTGGTHGYDPKNTSMHGLFIASGPAFNEGLTIDKFHNVDLYELMCKVMGLTPALNDGNADAGIPLLKTVE